MDEKKYKANSAALIKDVDSKKGIVKAYFAIFGNIDSDNDIIEPGAFKKSIEERGPDGSKRIKHFKWHSSMHVPGKLTQLGEDEKGGWFISQLSKTTLGKDTLIEYDEGIITEHSHGFQVIKEEEDEAGVNHIKESRLWEVSTLTAWGANHLTNTEFVKEIKSADQFIAEMKRLTSYLKVGRFSDELLEKAEKEYAELSAACKSLGIKMEPNKNTQKDDEPINLSNVTNLFRERA